MIRRKRFSLALLFCFAAVLPALADEHPEYRVNQRGLIPTSGLVAAWRGDGDATDRTGRNAGTLRGNGAGYAPAMVGRGFFFDGSSDAGVDVPDNPALHLTDAMTISAWVNVAAYPTPEAGTAMILFRGDDRPGLDPYHLEITPGGRLSFTVESGPGAGASVSAPIPAGRFVHVAATLDVASGRMRLYENGEVVAETTVTAGAMRDLDQTANPGIGIGNHGGFSTGSGFRYPFHGVINELLVYNRALIQSDIRAMYRDRLEVPSLTRDAY